jgi:hypothetical protein
MADVHLTLQEYHALRDEKRPHKFRARPEVYDGIHFPSRGRRNATSN